MVACGKVQKISCWFNNRILSLRRDGYAYIQLLTVVIGESLGDSIQRGRGRGGRGYMDKCITHKHQGKGFLFFSFW